VSDSGALSRRERQILEILYRAGKASAAEVRAAMGSDAPSYSAVRTLLGVLEEKGTSGTKPRSEVRLRARRGS